MHISYIRISGCNKRGCLQTQTDASKRAQTQTNADFRLSEKGPKTQVNARKRAQTRANARKRPQTRTNAKSKNFTPFTHPLLRQPKNTFSGIDLIYLHYTFSFVIPRTKWRKVLCFSGKSHFRYIIYSKECSRNDFRSHLWLECSGCLL